MLFTQARLDPDGSPDTGVDTPMQDLADPPRDFAAFVTTHRTGLVRYAAVLTGSVSQAEDIVQDVLVRLFARWDKLDDPLPYARRAVTNQHVSWRRRWSTRNITLRDLPDLDGPAAPLHDERPDPQMWAALMSLTRPQRTALVLRYFEDLDDDEISSVLGCRPATVRSHVHRGIAAIRRQLSDTHSTDWNGGHHD